MKKLYRSNENSRIAGVCGGIAEYFGVSAALLRLLVVILAFCSFGTTAVVYLIAAVIIPKAPHYDSPDYYYPHSHY